MTNYVEHRIEGIARKRRKRAFSAFSKLSLPRKVLFHLAVLGEVARFYWRVLTKQATAAEIEAELAREQADQDAELQRRYEIEARKEFLTTLAQKDPKAFVKMLDRTDDERQTVGVPDDPELLLAVLDEMENK